MFNYKVRVCVNGWRIDGSFTVEANNYDEAFKKAVTVINSKVSLPGSLSLGITDEDVDIVCSNAGDIFEKQLMGALKEYWSKNLKIIYDSYEYCLIYRSDNNTVKVFGIDGDEFIFEDEMDPEEWLTNLAKKYNIGYCFDI
jgi:hypothetical protein